MRIKMHLDWMEYPDYGADRDNWLDVRRTGIGASEAAAVVGMSPFASPYSVWAEKIGETGSVPDNDAMEWGRLLEEPVARKFAMVTGLSVARPDAMFVHDEHDWMLCSPDRFAGDPFEGQEESILEVKTSRVDGAWDDGVPAYYQLQVQHQLAVMGYPYAYLAVLLHGRDFRYWKVERDEKLIAHLIRMEAEFWELVETRTAPKADGSEATTRAIKAQFAEPSPGLLVALDDDTALLVDHLRVARAERDAADAIVADIENKVKAAMGDAEEAWDRHGNRLATWKAQTRRAIDTKALEADQPDLAEKYRKVTAFRRFVVAK